MISLLQDERDGEQEQELIIVMRRIQAPDALAFEDETHQDDEQRTDQNAGDRTSPVSVATM